MLGADHGQVCTGGGGREFIHAPCPHWLRAVEAGADPTSVWTFQPPISPWGMNDHILAALGPQKQLSPGLSDSQVYAGWGKGGCAYFLALLFSAGSFLHTHQGAVTCPHVPMSPRHLRMRKGFSVSSFRFFSEELTMKGTDFHAVLRLHKPH